MQPLETCPLFRPEAGIMPRLARPMANMGHKAIFKASDQDENRLKSKGLSDQIWSSTDCRRADH